MENKKLWEFPVPSTCIAEGGVKLIYPGGDAWLLFDYYDENKNDAVYNAGIVFDAINKAYMPWLFEKLKEDNYKEKKKIVKLTYLWFLIIMLGVLFSFILSPSLVLYIAGEDYAQAGEIIGWLILGQGFQGMYLMVTNYIFFAKKTSLLSVASIIAGLLNLFLLIVLVPVLGLKGAAIAFALSMGARFFITWLVAYKSHSMPWFDF